jgi:2-dehydro-3-deoxy-D-arabinonate dehydratase
MPPVSAIGVELRIERQRTTVYQGTTSADRMVRGFDELIAWLGRENRFPGGVVLLTGTGIVPPDAFTLLSGDLVKITINGIGTLVNSVVQGAPVSQPMMAVP